MYETGIRLRAARRRCKFPSAPVAATELGWVVGTYANSENACRRPSLANIRIYAEGFGVTTGWLLDGIPETEADNEAASFLHHAKRKLKMPPTGGVQRAATALARVRVLRGFKSAQAAADQFGWSLPNLRAHEAARASIPRRMAATYAFAYSVPSDVLDPTAEEVAIDWTAIAETTLPSRAKVEDFSARIAAEDRGRRPPLDWIPVYEPADLLRWAAVDRRPEDGNDLTFFPVLHGYVEQTFGVPAFETVVTALGPDHGFPARTSVFLHLALPASPEDRCLQVHEEGGTVQVSDEGRPSGGRTERGGSWTFEPRRCVRFRIVGELSSCGGIEPRGKRGATDSVHSLLDRRTEPVRLSHEAQSGIGE